MANFESLIHSIYEKAGIRSSAKSMSVGHEGCVERGQIDESTQVKQIIDSDLGRQLSQWISTEGVKDNPAQMSGILAQYAQQRGHGDLVESSKNGIPYTTDFEECTRSILKLSETTISDTKQHHSNMGHVQGMKNYLAEQDGKSQFAGETRTEILSELDKMIEQHKAEGKELTGLLAKRESVLTQQQSYGEPES